MNSYIRHAATAAMLAAGTLAASPVFAGSITYTLNRATLGNVPDSFGSTQ